MILTEQEIKEILSFPWERTVDFVRRIESAVLEKLKSQEPFGYYENGRFSVNTDGGHDKWQERKAHSGAVYIAKIDEVLK